MLIEKSIGLDIHQGPFNKLETPVLNIIYNISKS